MSKKIKWGILSTANIGVKKVIPAMQKGTYSEVVAIASRNHESAKRVAGELNIPTAYGSYKDLLADESIDAIYNPLPNHLHVPVTIECMEAGKHVLCEKPIALNTEELRRLIAVREQHKVKVGEAFMVHTHPQWITARQLINQGEIGDLKSIHGFFSYFNNDAKNIRNIAEYGGGALFDIGCYPIHTSRFIFGEEPTGVISLIDYDPDLKVDRLTSAILKFPSGQASFTAATQLQRYQTMQFFGTKKSMEIEVPFNAPDDQPCRILLNDGDIMKPYTAVTTIETCDQYTVQGDAFSLAILEDRAEPVPLEDSLGNTAVIEAIFKSARTGQWERPTS